MEACSRGGLIPKRGFEARPWEAVEEEDERALGIAKMTHAQTPAVLEQ